MLEPLIHVGILLCRSEIDFSLLSPCLFGSKEYSVGNYSARFSGGKISFDNQYFDHILFETDTGEQATFELKNVTIGKKFHWQRNEHQKFVGNLKLIVEADGISAVNIVALEDYLASVISSEMSATSALELLKAHAVISRSWLLAQMQKSKKDMPKHEKWIETDTEIYRWYDREEHTCFDVCADDHCQRYQGITRQSAPLVRQAIDETRGEVLMYDNTICDARFSKCCGGMTETFENVWEPIAHPYLQAKSDSIERNSFPDLSIDRNAEQWIRQAPSAFCNTQQKSVLEQVLNDYDQDTADFYRWEVIYSQKELAELIALNTGIDFGKILALKPIERGTSGRIIRLKIIGTNHNMIIGKELEIRKTLSTSHLYSSAFTVTPHDENNDGVPQRFTISGAGWGHGVGLCQIGAAVMAEKSYGYKEILKHYFSDTKIIKKY